MCLGPLDGQYILNHVFTTFRLSEYLEKDQESGVPDEGVGSLKFGSEEECGACC